MGEAKRRSVGDRKRAESPTEGHNAVLFRVARRAFAAIPTYLPAIGLCVGGTGVTNRAPRVAHCTRRRQITALS